jgi:hypothetical protein
MINKIIFSVIISLQINSIPASGFKSDSIKFDSKKIYALALDGNINAVLQSISKFDNSGLSESDLKLKSGFETRFLFEEDKSDFLNERRSGIDDLLIIYRDYWRSSFLDQSPDNDSNLKIILIDFFNRKYDASISFDDSIDASLDLYLKKYVSDSDLLTTGFAKTGKFYDLLIWKTQSDTLYEFPVHDENIESMVIFMDDFITLGWQEYATLGRHYPGGWASTDALYCVKKAYDLKSESFLVSYLAHEGRHFADYKIFPDLSGEDLEYRAKLTELSLAKESIHKLIEFFIKNGNADSDNPHAKANHKVIENLSKKIFQTDYESNVEMWKQVSVESVNELSYILLKENTEMLIKLRDEK